MKKIFTLCAAMVCGLTLSAKTIYLVPNDWRNDGAVFFAHSWDAQDNDAQLTAVSDNLYSATIPDGNNHILFVRMPNGSTSLNWDTKWNQTADLEIPSGMNTYTITGWGDNDGSWSADGQGGGGGQGGGQGGGGSVEGNPRYYYKMYTKSDETWHEPSEETLFDHGVADVISYSGEAYVFVIFQVDGQGGVQYRTEQYMDESNRQVKLVKEGPSDWRLPAGVTNLYLYDNEDGTLTLSADPIPGKKLADPQPDSQGIENATISQKAYKVIIDGQLRIVRGNKVFDATGREL